MTKSPERMLYRMDGRVEILCAHGVGHPSKKLQNIRGKRSFDHYDGVHGCDGCCSKEFWILWEKEAVDYLNSTMFSMV